MPLRVTRQTTSIENNADDKQLGLQALEEQRWLEAAAYLERALTSSPQDAEIMHSLALAKNGLGDGKSARSMLCQAIKTKPDWAEPHRSFAKFLAAENRALEAAQYACNAVDLNPEDTEMVSLLEQLRVLVREIKPASSKKKGKKHKPAVGPTQEQINSQLRRINTALSKAHAQKSAPGEGKISLCMIVKDEEQYLDECLKSAKEIVDEIIVVDTGSKDRTVKIAESHGAKVYKKKWTDNFSEARNAAIKHATGDWILVLDADEQLDSAARKAIQKAVKSPTADAYELLFRNYRSDGSPADAFIHPTCRLFRNRPEYSYTGRVHEQIVPSITAASGTVGRLNVHIDHYGYKPEVMKERGKHEKYIRLLKEDLEENPGSVQCMYNLGAAYSSAGEHELAVEWYEQAAEAVRPEHGFYAQAVFFSLVNSLCLAGKPADALAAAERAERLRIKHPELCCGKGTAYLILQRYQEAIAQFQKALQLGQSGVWTGDAGASGYKAYYGLGWAQVGLGNYQKSVEFCKKALNENPDDERTHEVIAHAYLCLGKTAECETHLKKWTSIKPDDTRAWTKLAEFYLNQGRPSDAEACYKILSDCGGKAAEVELGLGMCARMEGRLEEAEQHLKQATKLNTDCAKGFTELGRVQGEFGRVGEALQSFVRALEIDPSQVDAYFDAGRLLFSSGMYQEAANVLQNGLSVNPENAEGFLMLGDCYQKMGVDNAAVLAYRQALAIKPDYPEATERLAKVEKSPVQLKAA